MTPVQFQKRVRLQEARRGLSGASMISAVAYDVGYESISQFNRDYRRLFNLTPSEDAAMLRATLPSGSRVGDATKHVPTSLTRASHLN